jgi:hypothetical protein
VPPMLDVSDEVRAEIGDEEAARLVSGENAPGPYDCTSCRTPGNTDQEPTSTVLFVGEETAVLAFAHARCIPSQVVPVSEEQLQVAVRSITGDSPAAKPQSQPQHQPPASAVPPTPEEQAVLGITCGLVLCQDNLHPALVVEPTSPVARPGNSSHDEFLVLLGEAGFHPVSNLEIPPPELTGWSVLMAMGKLHAVLQGSPNAANASAWWQAHQPLPVSEGWRSAANRSNKVFVYAAPAGTIGRQPREDLLRDALDRAASAGQLVGGTMPLAGT